MDARGLQRLRRRVERGERLSEADLQRLRAAADEEARAVAEVLAGRGKPTELLGRTWEGFAKTTVREHGGLRATWTEERRGSDDVLAQVIPVLAPAVAPGLLSREGPAGLAVTYLSQGRLMSAEGAPASLDEVDRAAWTNLASRVAEPRPVIVDRGQPRLSPEPLGLWALCEADGADGARLVTAEQRRRLFEVVGPGPYRVCLARPELALVAQLLDPSAVGALETVEPRPEGIRGRFALQPDGTLQSLGAA